MKNTEENSYFLNQDIWKQSSINSTYPRQIYMNSFEKSVENLENSKKIIPRLSNHTVPIDPTDIDEENHQNMKPVKSKPFLCRYFINLCKIIGNGWLLSSKSNYKLDRSDILWCVPDICGSICAVITWMLIGYAAFVVIFVMVLPAPSFYFRWINGVGFIFLSLLAFLSHLKSMLTNPGTISLGTATTENIQKVCSDNKKTVYKCIKCNSIKPQRAHHCSICQRCVMKMDHHCPWVNNCIGENNQKYFVLFTFYICVISIYSIYISIHFFVMCVGSEWEECKNGFSPAASTILIVFLLVEGVLFGLFTAIMCGEQLQSIWMDETAIETLRKERATWERRSKWVNMQALFGYPPSWKWLCPLIEPNFQSLISDSNTNSLHIV